MHASWSSLLNSPTSLFGLLKNIGTGILGLHVVAAGLEMPAWLLWTGLVLTVVGGSIGSLASADNRDVEQIIAATPEANVESPPAWVIR